MMSGPPRAKPMHLSEPEARTVLGPAGNKARSIEFRKPILKPKSEKTGVDESKGKDSPAALQSPEMASDNLSTVVGLRKKGSSGISTLNQRKLKLSMSASCSSDASSDSSHSRSSTGKISWKGKFQTPPVKKKQQCSSEIEKNENKEENENNVGAERQGAVVIKRCAWVTPNTDPSYVAFHDEEWGLPVHDDKKLFELLTFSTALAELAWPAILSKRHLFRDVFLDFDPVAVSKLNDKKIATTGSPASSLLSEVKLRAVIENARQICKIINEVGSFDKYIWGFVNYKPIVNNFRYPRQVPIKTSKADTISKDLVKRGFRGVGPTVVYSFMQVAGITNDHLISCFRYQDCIIACDRRGKSEGITSKNDEKLSGDIIKLELISNIDDINCPGS
ncbi:DNA glycosylase superfamily protein [Striga hermonthica]|uniref:DNA glycosylase superfamily protein n=1 Tax=Striga hermonthica TaxID=68872 RepID=A0A9N7RF10_STRHE|nr:DNA glycosylase superfamily protein [Striga hermonthica]